MLRRKETDEQRTLRRFTESARGKKLSGLFEDLAPVFEEVRHKIYTEVETGDEGRYPALSAELRALRRIETSVLSIISKSKQSRQP